MKKTKVMLFHEKHGYRLFLAETQEQMEAAALKVLTDRLADGWWFDEEDEKEIERVVKHQDKAAALTIIAERSRQGYEYEEWHFEYLEEV